MTRIQPVYDGGFIWTEHNTWSELFAVDYLAMLSDGSDDHSNRCAICESEGACRTWVEDMAKDANVPAQWIAEQVIAGIVNRYTTIAEINRLYLPF